MTKPLISLLSVLSVIIFLNGCSTTETVLRPIEIEVPILQPCPIEKRTMFASSEIEAQMPIDMKVKKLILALLEHKEYEANLESCVMFYPTKLG